MTRTSQRKSAKVNDTASRIEPRTKTAIRKIGGLSQLMNMPMDILMEIFGYLHPLDLLHLARTTKAFRRVLMHRSSLFVWKAVLSAVLGLPDCPPDLSEPQWANLVFDAHCSVCLRPNIRTIDWFLRVRLCAECTKEHITHFDYFFYKEGYDVDVKRAVPTRRGKGGRSVFLRDEYMKVHTQYRAIEDPCVRQAFLVEREQLLEGIKEHVKLCVAWASSQVLARSGELDHMRSDRYQAIVEKLVALGWGDEINKFPEYHDLRNHKLVKVPQLLTDRIWENIRGTMIKYMEEMKSNRLAHELAQLHAQRQLASVKLLQQYKAQCAPFMDVMPEVLDFSAFGPIKEIIEQPSDINVNSESFLHLIPELDGMVEEWRRTILVKFTQEVKADIVTHSVVLDDILLQLDNASNECILQHIQLACTVFSCTFCKGTQGFDDELFFMGEPFDDDFPTKARSFQTRPLWFPRVLGHRCLTKPRGYTIDDNEGNLSIRTRYQQPWTCDSMIIVDEKACEAAVAIIRACEMDPRFVTVDEMDQLGARVECLACWELELEDPNHVVFGWRSAVKHQRERHSSDPGNWRMLTPSEAKVARDEEGKIQGVIPSDQKVWLCLHCLDLPAEESWRTLEDVESHVQHRHDVEIPRANQDYVKDFAAPELYATLTLFEATVVEFPE